MGTRKGQTHEDEDRGPEKDDLWISTRYDRSSLPQVRSGTGRSDSEDRKEGRGRGFVRSVTYWTGFLLTCGVGGLGSWDPGEGLACTLWEERVRDTGPS